MRWSGGRAGLLAGSAASGRFGWRGERVCRERFEEGADFVADLGCVAHGTRAVDFVVVPAAHAGRPDVARGHEFGEDSLRGALGDADPGCDVAEADVGVLCEAEEHLGVVGEEGPALVGIF